jgi:hypothetical protein
MGQVVCEIHDEVSNGPRKQQRWADGERVEEPNSDNDGGTNHVQRLVGWMAMLTQVKRVEGFKRSVFLVGVYILRHKPGRQRDQRCKMHHEVKIRNANTALNAITGACNIPRLANAII